MAESGGDPQEVKRYCKADLQAFVTGQFKTFCKEPCAECGNPASKRFAKSMSFVVSQMLESFWCPECGRVLCEPHRYQHTCEKLDQMKERNKNISHEQLASQMAEVETRKEAAEEEKKVAARQEAEAVEQEKQVRKSRRLILAKKAKAVENFLQGISRDTDANEVRGPRVRDELFELYTKAKRISLTLYNEYEHPTMPGLAEDDWEAMKEIYSRTRELSHMYAQVEEGPLDMRNPWDPPPPPTDEANYADGAGLGRGLL